MVEDDLEAIKQTQSKKSESDEKPKESTKFSVPESPLKKRFPSGPYLTSSSESVSSTPEKSSRPGHYSGDHGLNGRPKKTVRLSTDSNDSVFMSSTPKQQAATSNDGKTAQNGSKSGPAGKPPKRPRGRPPGTTKKIMEKRRSMENNITYNNKENNIADDDNDFADMPELEETPTDHEELFYDDLPTLEEIHPQPEDDDHPETEIRSPKIFSKTKSKPLKRKSLPQMPKQKLETSPVKKQRRGIRRTKSDRLEPYV